MERILKSNHGNVQILFQYYYFFTKKGVTSLILLAISYLKEKSIYFKENKYSIHLMLLIYAWYNWIVESKNIKNMKYLKQWYGWDVS